MLQPLKLEDVSQRYATEIEDLREFLATTHLPLDTGETLGRLTARLGEDVAFRRDLTSHLWVLLDAFGQKIQYADLMGIVAVAAAGPQFAAIAGEAEAHGLLRFLMASRRSFGAMPQASGRLAVLPNTVLPTVLPAAVQETAIPLFAAAMPVSRLDALGEMVGRRPALWAAATLGLFALLVGGIWLHRPAAPDVRTQTAATGGSVPASSPATPSGVGSSPAVAPSHERTTVRPELPRRVWRRKAQRPAAQPDVLPAATPALAAAVRRPLRPLPAGVKDTVDANGIRIAKVDLSNTAVPRIEGTSHADRSRADRSRESSVASSPAHGGYVRPTSLGTMAANVMYSPAPSYPAAASAARVQGEVKLEAEVDRDGNVVSTRVISGPDQLRAASEDAVQQWRYRPFLYHGKPVAMNATVVMDFHLP